MRKTDVVTRYERGEYRPALNVKCYAWPNADKAIEAFGCSRAIAEQAMEYAYQSEQERFWEDAQEWLADAVFGAGACEIHQEGRLGGWLVVTGLPDVDTWDARQLAKWAKFARIVRADIASRCEWGSIRENIESNRWAEEGAELYNFRDVPNAPPVCLAEVNRATKAAIAQVYSSFGLKARA